MNTSLSERRDPCSTQIGTATAKVQPLPTRVQIAVKHPDAGPHMHCMYDSGSQKTGQLARAQEAVELLVCGRPESDSSECVGLNATCGT